MQGKTSGEFLSYIPASFADLRIQNVSPSLSFPVDKPRMTHTSTLCGTPIAVQNLQMHRGEVTRRSVPPHRKDYVAIAPKAAQITAVRSKEGGQWFRGWGARFVESARKELSAS